MSVAGDRSETEGYIPSKSGKTLGSKINNDPLVIRQAHNYQKPDVLCQGSLT